MDTPTYTVEKVKRKKQKKNDFFLLSLLVIADENDYKLGRDWLDAQRCPEISFL